MFCLLNSLPSVPFSLGGFVHCQSSVFHSQPKSTVGTPAYVAPEVLIRKAYDGKVDNLFLC